MKFYHHFSFRGLEPVRFSDRFELNGFTAKLEITPIMTHPQSFYTSSNDYMYYVHIGQHNANYSHQQ